MSIAPVSRMFHITAQIYAHGAVCIGVARPSRREALTIISFGPSVIFIILAIVGARRLILSQRLFNATSISARIDDVSNFASS